MPEAKCTYCGTAIDAGAARCPGCGRGVEEWRPDGTVVVEGGLIHFTAGKQALVGERKSGRKDYGLRGLILILITPVVAFLLPFGFIGFAVLVVGIVYCMIALLAAPEKGHNRVLALIGLVIATVVCASIVYAVLTAGAAA